MADNTTTTAQVDPLQQALQQMQGWGIPNSPQGINQALLNAANFGYQPSHQIGAAPGQAAGPTVQGSQQQVYNGNASVPLSTYKPSALDQAASLTFGELGTQQQLADQQWGRINQQAQGFSGLAQQGQQQIQGTAQGTAGGLMGLAGMALKSGQQAYQQPLQQQQTVEANFDKTLPQYNAELDQQKSSYVQANQYALDAINNMKGVISNYTNKTYEDQAAMVSGLNRNFSNAQQQLASGFGADGMPMTPDQINEASRQMRSDMNSQINGSVQQMQSTFRQNVAQLGQSLSNVMLQGGQTAIASGQGIGQVAAGRLAGASAQAGVYEQTEQQVQQGQAQKEAYQQLASGLAQSAASILNSQGIAGLQFKMAGMDEAAKIIEQNPKSIVSYTSGLMNLIQLAKSGVNQLTPVNIPSGGR